MTRGLEEVFNVEKMELICGGGWTDFLVQPTHSKDKLWIILSWQLLTGSEAGEWSQRDQR